MAMVFNHNSSRTGYRTGDCIDFATFNALIDNESIGDERFNFVRVRREGEEEFKKVIKVDIGDKFTVRVYFHNNADTSLGEGKGTAYDTRIRFDGGAFCSDEGEWEAYGIDYDGIMGYIESANSNPKRVQDFCVIDLPEFQSYDYIEGSARITTKAGTQPFPKSGGLIGIGQLDGVIPPGEFGYVELDYVVV